MKKFHRWLIGISLIGMLVSGIASASFKGGTVGGVSAATLLNYFYLPGNNTATGSNVFAALTQFAGPVLAVNDIESDITGTVTNNQRRGYHVRHNEAGSVCLGPSDGVNKSFCLSNQGGLGKFEAQSGVLYGTATSASIGFAMDYLGGGRMSLAPTGVTSIGAGTTTAADTTLTVGSNTRAAATFLVDATNDWTKHLPISAPAASECDAATEKGRMYYDSTSDEFKYCNGTAWTSFGGGGGGNATVLEYFYEFPENADITYYTDARLELAFDTSGVDLEVNVTSLPSGNFYSHSCRNYNSQTESSRNTTGTQDIWGSLSSGVHVDCVISANDDASWPSYYLTAFNTGSGDNATVSLRVVSN